MEGGLWEVSPCSPGVQGNRGGPLRMYGDLLSRMYMPGSPATVPRYMLPVMVGAGKGWRRGEVHGVEQGGSWCSHRGWLMPYGVMCTAKGRTACYSLWGWMLLRRATARVWKRPSLIVTASARDAAGFRQSVMMPVIVWLWVASVTLAGGALMREMVWSLWRVQEGTRYPPARGRGARPWTTPTNTPTPTHPRGQTVAGARRGKKDPPTRFGPHHRPPHSPPTKEHRHGAPHHPGGASPPHHHRRPIHHRRPRTPLGPHCHPSGAPTTARPQRSHHPLPYRSTPKLQGHPHLHPSRIALAVALWDTLDTPPQITRRPHPEIGRPLVGPPVGTRSPHGGPGLHPRSRPGRPSKRLATTPPSHHPHWPRRRLVGSPPTQHSTGLKDPSAIQTHRIPPRPGSSRPRP